jgi:hypothetical protein
MRWKMDWFRINRMGESVTSSYSEGGINCKTEDWSCFTVEFVVA